MEAVIFVGIQGSGKTTFYRERLLETHVRISMDLLRTRRREGILLAACLSAGQPFAVDNTNPRVADRASYIQLAKAAGFRVIGYFFRTGLRDALRRNSLRPGKKAIPIPGVAGTLKRLEPPTPAEGFDELYTVSLEEGKGFTVASWTAPDPGAQTNTPAVPAAPNSESQ
jgi:predicted kinase